LIFLSQKGELVNVAIIEDPLPLIIQAVCHGADTPCGTRQGRRWGSVYAGCWRR
jgi:hypothetical protein